MNFFTKLLTPVFITLGLVNPTPIAETPTPDIQILQELIELRQKIQELENQNKPDMEVENQEVEEVVETKPVEVKKEVVEAKVAPDPKPVVEVEPTTPSAEVNTSKKISTSEFNTFLASDSNLSISYKKAQIQKPILDCSINYITWNQIISPSEEISKKKKEIEGIIEENYKPSNSDKRNYKNLIEWITGVSSFSPGYSKEIQEYVIANTPNPETYQFDFSSFDVEAECIKEAENIIAILIPEKLSKDKVDKVRQEWINTEILKLEEKLFSQERIRIESRKIISFAETMDFNSIVRGSIDAEIKNLNELINLLER